MKISAFYLGYCWFCVMLKIVSIFVNRIIDLAIIEFVICYFIIFLRSTFVLKYLNSSVNKKKTTIW